MKKLKKRLNREFTDLIEKKLALEAFIGGEKFFTLGKVQKSLLIVQLDAMSTYTTCLYERIQDLKDE